MKNLLKKTQSEMTGGDTLIVSGLSLILMLGGLWLVDKSLDM